MPFFAIRNSVNKSLNTAIIKQITQDNSWKERVIDLTTMVLLDT